MGKEALKIVQSFLTKNPCYTSKRTIKPKGLMLHSVGCSQPSAAVFIKNWNTPSQGVCVHGFIDANSGTVYQTLPWTKRASHAGSGKKGSANDTHIGIEMCEPASIRYKKNSATFYVLDYPLAIECVKRTYQAAILLFAELCIEFGLNPLEKGVIISHKEGCAMGIASNHSDPEHLWTQLGLPYTMETFRKAVYEETQRRKGLIEVVFTEKELTEFIEKTVKNMGRNNPAPSTWAAPLVEKAKERGLTDGSNPHVLATREEVMIMALRANEK